jgi:fluoride exporter
MREALFVALGGALGSVARHLVNTAAVRMFGPVLPLGTFCVNLAGSFAMGVFVELLARRFGGSPELRLFVATGILGGFTTFSSFSLDAAVLWQRGDPGLCFAYVAGTLVLGIGALFAGLMLARQFA